MQVIEGSLSVAGEVATGLLAQKSGGILSRMRGSVMRRWVMRGCGGLWPDIPMVKPQ